MDETCTPMGSRLLAEWLSSPLTDIEQITQRQDAIEELVNQLTLRDDVRELLKETYDLQRLTSRIATGRCSPRDLVCLAKTLGQLPRLRAKLAERKSKRLQTLEQRIELCPEAHAAIVAAIVDEPPLTIADGGVIRPGFNSDLDEFRDLMRGGRQWMAAYQQKEIERTGISNLKIGFNKVFGYYLEVTASHSAKVPDEYIRKQTLKNQERYITPELKEYEEKVLRAEDRAKALEQELFADAARTGRDLCSAAADEPRIRWRKSMFWPALSTLAANANYCRPTADSRTGRRYSRWTSSGARSPASCRSVCPE